MTALPTLPLVSEHEHEQELKQYSVNQLMPFYSDLDWMDLYSEQVANEAWSKLIGKFINTYGNFMIPCKRKHNKLAKKPWIARGIFACNKRDEI